MYGSQAEMNAMAQAAKKQLAEQNGETPTASSDVYAGLGLDEEVKEERSNRAPIKEEPHDYQMDFSKSKEADEETVMRNIERESPQLDPFDDELFPGGPTKSQINIWKKDWDGYDIYVTEILKETFVFRTLNRFEYKQLVSFIEINGLQREETICATCTLWPPNYDYQAMATTKAGIPSTYSEIIMEKSGFTKDFAIQEI